MQSTSLPFISPLIWRRRTRSPWRCFGWDFGRLWSYYSFSRSRRVGRGIALYELHCLRACCISYRMSICWATELFCSNELLSVAYLNPDIRGYIRSLVPYDVRCMYNTAWVTLIRLILYSLMVVSLYGSFTYFGSHCSIPLVATMPFLCFLLLEAS
jgi:hypothetical protein